jgi:LPPG:FO 2-phospho-L-lactate transferase
VTRLQPGAGAHACAHGPVLLLAECEGCGARYRLTAPLDIECFDCGCPLYLPGERMGAGRTPRDRAHAPTGGEQPLGYAAAGEAEGAGDEIDRWHGDIVRAAPLRVRHTRGMHDRARVVVLAGGYGGARMAHGFELLGDEVELTVVGNTGDDLVLHGLHVSPDLDTVLYMLADLVNEETGWGLSGETWSALEMLERYGQPTWFRIGDGDLATHVHRSRLLREGASLTDATAQLAAALDVPSTILPATDHRLRTIVQTDAGDLEFQEYFVRRGQRDELRGIELDGIEHAVPSPAVLAALDAAELIVIAPSNPLVSIGPILAMPGMREALDAAGAPKVAVSPIVAGRALRGPADRMLASLGHQVSALGVARMYAGVVNRFVVDEADAELAPDIERLGMECEVLPTVMRSVQHRAALAGAIVGRYA